MSTRRWRHLTEADQIEAKRMAQEHGLDDLQAMVADFLHQTTVITLVIGIVMGGTFVGIVRDAPPRTLLMNDSDWRAYAVLVLLTVVMFTYVWLCERLRYGLTITLACNLYPMHGRDRNRGT